MNLGNPHEVTVLQLATLIRDLTGSISALQHLDPAPDDPTRRCPDIRLANKALGWVPRIGLDEGLRRTIAWFTSNPRLAPIDGAEPAESRILTR